LAKRKGSKDQLSQQRDAIFHLEFREDLQRWVQTDRKLALRYLQLVEVIMRDPFRGIGKSGRIETRFVECMVAAVDAGAPDCVCCEK
jgi:Txe/YoeB family toxin of Txe-Axe toxin-antitoxin module